MYKILITDPLADTALSILEEAPDVTFETAYGLSADELRDKIQSFNAVIIRSATKITREILDNAESLKAIGRAGTGLDNIDLETADRKGVRVFNTPGTNAPAVAELTIGMLFALARKIAAADATMKAGKWEKKTMGGGYELGDKKLGIVGCGTIGKLVAQKGAALGMEILVTNRSAVKLDKVSFEQLPLDKLLQKSDFVTIHLPKSDKTMNYMGKAELKMMKETAFLVNTSRGGVVNEKDLLACLDDGVIAGAALDVYENEPNYNKELAAHPSVVATPHIAASTKESQERVGVQIVDKVLEYLRSKYIFL